MSRITQDLLRKRAEHNQCILTTLQEVSLHQQELVRIQNLDILCRHLKILYLQNNIIERMENLHKLKQLQYLNLALNNISMIQDIDGCQSLKKLDLTLNFIDGQDFQRSMDCLEHCPNIKELHMTGNPCMDWKFARNYIAARVPQLQVLDSKAILPSQRIKSVQMLKEMQFDLQYFIQQRHFQKIKKEKQFQDQIAKRKKQAELKGEEYKDTLTSHSKQSRRKMYNQLAQDKIKKEKERFPEKFVEKKETPMFNSSGQIRQCNQGRYRYSLRQNYSPQITMLQVQVPRYMDTSLLVVKLDPKWVSVRIKGKLLQLRLDDQIEVAGSKSQRSQTTGYLNIFMKKIKVNQIVARQKKIQNQMKVREEQQRKKTLKQKEQKEADEKSKRLMLCSQFQKKMAAKEAELDQLPDLQ